MTIVAPKTISPTPTSRRRQSGRLLTSEEEGSATDCRQSACQYRDGKLQREAAGAWCNRRGRGRGTRLGTWHRCQEAKRRGGGELLADHPRHGVRLGAGCYGHGNLHNQDRSQGQCREHRRSAGYHSLGGHKSSEVKGLRMLILPRSARHVPLTRALTSVAWAM